MILIKYISLPNKLKALYFIAGMLLTIQGASQNADTVHFKVSGECIQCKHRIEKALKIQGITYADWNISTKKLEVIYDSTRISFESINDKIAAVGHDTELKKAKDDVYKALPDCCLYRDIQNDAELNENKDHENDIRGIVVSEDLKGNFFPMEGAAVMWMGTKHGTVTDKHGVFSISPDTLNKFLVITYTGYQSDTLEVTNHSELQVILALNGQLKTVSVSAKQRAYINTFSPIRLQTIISNDLLKAACCNLSESFETSPAVDVSYSDAITGAKQIQLLGLAGIYTLLTVENLPGLQGLATPSGLNSIAGPWIESIQLSKGTGSVVNGFESIAGQINVELKKPATADKLYLNSYVNEMGKTDLNVTYFQKFGDHWATGLLLHDDFLTNKIDMNKDGFRDLPTGNLLSVLNRWHYDNNKGVKIQFGLKVLKDDKTGGENQFHSDEKFSTEIYGFGMNIEREEGYAKIGYIFPEKKYKSIGLQLSASSFKQSAFFGITPYDALQKTFYSNLIFQSIIGNTDHTFRSGMSFSANNYHENYADVLYSRKENVPGAFFEYSYKHDEKFSLVVGIRTDYSNLYGWFITPRLNLRYEPITGTIIRVSAGRGQHTANIFAENIGLMASSRILNIIPSTVNGAYGLAPEIAWNKGISIDQHFRIFKKEAILSLDYYRNDFINQVIVDLENPGEVIFYNLTGPSYSNSFQLELNLIPLKDLEIRLAYRNFDIRTQYGSKILEKPLSARQRGFANFAYSKDDWKIDYTINFTGEKRIPPTASNPMEYQFPNISPAYITMNAQLSKTFGKNKNWGFYIGAENLTNFFQHVVIIAADQPFGKYFDAGLIYGPLSGRLFYMGLRYTIK
ncbi:MAG: TonB-dependent receptor [Bacteroidetes bacterium]|nr:TonB-dependent receptor [Bacteroidota bacterium]